MKRDLQQSLRSSSLSFVPMLSQTIILSLLLSGSVAYASSPGPRRLDLPNGPRSNATASRTIQRRTAGVPITPADWPTTTQAGPIPSYTKASTADPYLNSLSYALNNAGNSLFTAQYTGELTYYDTASVACGDVYDDSTYTAAISHELYDSWPGFTAGSNTNRTSHAYSRKNNRSQLTRHPLGNPVCGPWVPGRQIQNQVTGAWEQVVSSSDGTVQ